MQTVLHSMPLRSTGAADSPQLPIMGIECRYCLLSTCSTINEPISSPEMTKRIFTSPNPAFTFPVYGVSFGVIKRTSVQSKPEACTNFPISATSFFAIVSAIIQYICLSQNSHFLLPVLRRRKCWPVRSEVEKGQTIPRFPHKF